MKIKSYLAILILVCLMGGYLVEKVQSDSQREAQQQSEKYNDARLWIKGLERAHADTFQYLISTDLILGSGESYLVAGTKTKGDLINQAIKQLVKDNHLLPNTTQLNQSVQQIKQINAYLEESADEVGVDRNAVLVSLLNQYDGIALQLSEQMGVTLSTAKQSLLDNKIKLADLHQKSRSTQTNTRLLFSFGLLLLWYWANSKICNPVTRLTQMADSVLRGEVFEGIKNGPKETQQLSNNLTALTNTLSHQANHDSLTNLYNRRAFQRILTNSVTDANDSGTSNILCYIDLDRFKMVNDTCGHYAGDKLLVEVAELLQDNVRDSDIVARLGGDEFAILLVGCKSSTGQRISNKILNSIRDIRFAWEDEIFTISASIGITLFTGTDTNTSNRPQELINTADMACKQAKESGRDNVQIFDVSDEIISKKRNEIHWVNKLNTALEQNHFVLFKQNIVPIGATHKNGDHFEILIRMMANDGSLLPPGDFIPIAERYHLGARLDKWVVNAVIEWFLAHPVELNKLSMCSINLSGQSIGNKSIQKFIINKLHATNFPTEKLCFEITETAAVTDLTNAHQLIDELRALGCKFSLDDFGSGLSSFAYLKDLPVDTIKIDGSFIQDMMSDKVSLATVEAINGVAKAVGKQTIAEFVETLETVKELEKIGVDFAQGYYFHKPEPLKDQAMVKLNVTSESTQSEPHNKLTIVK